MTPQETVLIVGYLNRAGLLWAMEGQGQVWHDAIGDRVSYPDAQEAARTLARTRGGEQRNVTPADLLTAVRRLRAARITGVPGDALHIAPPEPLDVTADLLWRRTYLAALGDGRTQDQAEGEANARLGLRPEPLVGPPTELRALTAAVAEPKE